MAKLKSIVTNSIILIMAILLTIGSTTFVRPVNCQSLCSEEDLNACPPGACQFFEQRAGLPLPFLVDSPGGGSPTNGWGILGPEDLPDPFAFLLDVAFFLVLIGWIRNLFLILFKGRRAKWLAVWLPLVIIAAGLAAGYYSYQPVLLK